MTHEVAGARVEDLVLMELDGELPPERASAYRAHIAACSDCQRVRSQHRVLAARLAAPVAPGSSEARVRAAVRAGQRPSAWDGLRAGLAAVTTAVILVVAAGWLASYRVGVAGDGLPVLYREDVARIAAGDAGDGTLAVVVKRHAAAPGELRAFATLQLQVEAADLPGVAEIRFLEDATTAHGVLGRIRLEPEDRASGRSQLTMDAPFPPVARGDRMQYRIWVSVDGPRGERRSPELVIEVSGEAGGQRAKTIAP